MEPSRRAPSPLLSWLSAHVDPQVHSLCADSLRVSSTRPILARLILWRGNAPTAAAICLGFILARFAPGWPPWVILLAGLTVGALFAGIFVLNARHTDRVEGLAAQLMAAAMQQQGAIALAQSGGQLHPVIGAWPVAHADGLEAALHAGVRKVLRWTDIHGTIPVAFAFVDIGGEEVDPFFNANTPEELDEARRLLALKAA